MPDNETIRKTCESLIDEMTAFLDRLVRFESLPGYEGPAIDCVYEQLKDVADTCEKVPIPEDIVNDPEYQFTLDDRPYEGRPNIRAVIKGDGTGKSVIFNAHIDVVPPSTGHDRPFDPYVKDGALYGRGASDDKSQIAVMWTMLMVMKKLGIKPFGDPENTSQFDYELGLNIPCAFRNGEKCEIYSARPLNCRIFPYFFLANFEAGQLKDVIDLSHKCMQSPLTITPEEKERYREYAEYIGRLIMEEAKLTEQFYTKNGMKQSKILPAYIFPAEDPNDPMHAKEITKSKIKMAMQIMDKSRYRDLKNKLQNFIMRVERDIIPLNEINMKEKDILNP